jgi:hypothetical protein
VILPAQAIVLPPLAMCKIIDHGVDLIDQRNRELEAAAIVTAALTFEKAARERHEEFKPR